MMAQNGMTESSALLDENGYLIQKGWAKQLILNYDRKAIQGWGSSLRVKEWDCYEIMNSEFGLSLIIADVGYFGMATVTLLDFKEKKVYPGLGLKLFTRGKLNLPPSANEGDSFFEKGNSKLSFVRNGDRLLLSVDLPHFNKRGIKGEITLYKNPNQDTMVNVIPFKNKRHFVYVQKANCMPAEGTVHFGDAKYEFSQTNNSFACLDWSRGVFPYRTTWYWGSASSLCKGKPFGFNLDYGFGDESVSSKNMILYDGVGHKLDQITFHFDRNDWMKPWTFTSNDGRFEMALEPIFHNKTSLNLLILKTGGNKVWGYYTGDCILDTGEKLHIDKLFGFAETFSHRW